mmetsp:Transcript_9231/g.18871  ORF Transcript_9231/g.18871 Transcript_9231/m.18871 type:complete len:277 (+) Transcript_9231:157-987(+)
MSSYGGGFGGGGGFNSPGADTPTKPRKSYDDQTLVPMTIRQITTAQSDENGGGQIIYNGREVHHVKFVAAVRTIDEQSTNVTYEVEDGTGKIEARKWVNDAGGGDAQEDTVQKIREHSYVRIVGQVKDYDGRRSVVAYSVRKLSSPNEITHHFLEAIYVKNKGGGGGGGGTRLNMGGMVSPNMPSNSMYGAVGGGQSLAANGGNNMNSAGGSPVNNAVLEYIRVEGESSEVGADLTECIQHLHQFSENEVRAAVDSLSHEGAIYSTIDDTKYKYAL